jgi:hypothetical protein
MSHKGSKLRYLLWAFSEAFLLFPFQLHRLEITPNDYKRSRQP